MKKLLLLMLVSLFAFSCEEDESCMDTIADELNFELRGQITVIDQAGLPVEGYPVRIVYQKHWCDGDVGLAAEFSGMTNAAGVWNQDGIQYSLNNEKDYITVDYAAGSGGHTDQFSYDLLNGLVLNGFYTAKHQFEIIR